MAALTKRRQAELNKAIIGYLKKNGFDSAVSELEAQMGIKYEKKFEGNLERKWTAVTKLSAKILRLEGEVEQLREDLKNFGRGKVRNPALVLPRGPAKHICAGHKQPITCVAFHPVYSQVVSSSEDCTIKVWDSEEGSLEKTLKGHIDVVQHVSFNQDGKQFVSCSADLAIKVWNIEAGTCIKTMRGHDHTVSCVEFTPAGDHLVSCSRDKTIKFWDVQSGYCLRTIEGHSDWVRQVKVSPCSQLFASCSIDHSVRIWDYKKGEEVITFRDHKHVVDHICFSHEKADQILLKYVSKEDLSGSNAKTADSNSSNGESKKSDKQPKEEAKTDSSSPQQRNGGGSSSAFNGSSGTTNGGESRRVYSPQFLASASRDKTIKIFHISSGVLVADISGHENWVRSVIFHPSGKYLISCADDKTIRVWDLEKQFRCKKILEDCHDPFVTSIDYNMARPMLASGGVDNLLKIWECH
mmetsp:Transcript_20132/g.27977  ORF Transcript_20132/g.27977 Transcript_20132/m.27977 type:complete len:468 (-) Transcript_20132:303-1706(-)